MKWEEVALKSAKNCMTALNSPPGDGPNRGVFERRLPDPVARHTAGAARLAGRESSCHHLVRLDVRHHGSTRRPILLVKPIHLLELPDTGQWDELRGQRLGKPNKAIYIPHEFAFLGWSIMKLLHFDFV
jgi:hypothetical protein